MRGCSLCRSKFCTGLFTGMVVASVIWLLIIVLVQAVGCTSAKDETSIRQNIAVKYLPAGAENIQYLGNGWLTFSLGDRTYLYQRIYRGYNGYCAITQVR